MLGVASVLCAAASGWDPVADRAAFRAHYERLFPAVDAADFVDGVYAIDPDLAAQRDDIEEFPPYEFDLDEGRAIYETPFDDGATYAECLGVDAATAGRTYPRWSEETGEVVTLALALNRCRTAHGEAPWSWEKGPLARVLAWLAYSARGGALQVPAPASAGALAAYEAGRAFFFTKRGRLNFSCADCHYTAAGRRLREQRLTPLLGVVSRYPAYWLRWGSLGTLHQRVGGCMELVRAAPYPPQSAPYRALEYFLAVMGDGLPMRGPSTQR